MIKRAAAAAIFVTACGHAAPAVTTPAAAPDGVTPGIAPAAWLVGDWESADGGREAWLAVAGALHGVRFTRDGDFTASIIDDAGDGKALVRWTYAHERITGPVALGDEPKRTGDDTMIDGGVTWHRGLGQTAATAEDTDREFFAATRDHKADGWVSFFADDGVSWAGGEVVKGHDAIRAEIAPLLEVGEIRWTPVGSRLAPGGALAFTVGTSDIRRPGKPPRLGSYQTVWTQQPDGTWKVIADAGRPDDERNAK